jgi:hypothetical protein
MPYNMPYNKLYNKPCNNPVGMWQVSPLGSLDEVRSAYADFLIRMQKVENVEKHKVQSVGGIKRCPSRFEHFVEVSDDEEEEVYISRP